MMETEQRFQFPLAKQTPSRFRNALSKYRIAISKACNNCGICMGLCPYGVYRGSKRPQPANQLPSARAVRRTNFLCLPLSYERHFIDA
jgi:ferredoxin